MEIFIIVIVFLYVLYIPMVILSYAPTVSITPTLSTVAPIYLIGENGKDLIGEAGKISIEATLTGTNTYFVTANTKTLIGTNGKLLIGEGGKVFLWNKKTGLSFLIGEGGIIQTTNVLNNVNFSNALISQTATNLSNTLYQQTFYGNHHQDDLSTIRNLFTTIQTLSEQGVRLTQ